MAINLIETASVFQTELDASAKEIATSGWMELNDKFVKYEGGSEIKIAKLSTDGLADYSRENGFVEGAVTLEWETKKMEMDRGRQFTLDEHDVTETNFTATAASVMGEFQNTHVIPEIDAYRYSKIASLAMTKNRASYGYVPTESDILKKLYDDITRVQDALGDGIPLVITMSRTVSGILSTSSELAKKLDVSDFKQGDITLKVRSIDGQHPIIPVGSGRMKTTYIFKDGKSSEQKKGGFEAAPGAKNINWIICPRNVPIAVSRTDKIRIFDPETYQKKRAWAMDYRKFHDLWIPDNKWEYIFVNIKEAQ